MLEEDQALNLDFAENEIVEELPASDVTEEIPVIDNEEIPTFDDSNIDLPVEGESAEIEEEPVFIDDELSETFNDLNDLNEVGSNETSNVENNPAEPETDKAEQEQEILYNVEKITEAVGIIQVNQKTAFENLTLISTCSLGLNCMMFGGFVIFCYLNRLG